MSTSTLTWDTGTENDDKGRRNDDNGPRVRNRRARTVTVQGDPGDPPKVGSPLSQSGIMVPYFIGRQRIFRPNAIWYGNLDLMYETESEVISREVEEVGDDNVVVRTPITTVQETTYVSGYRLDVHLGLCLGPDVHLREIYIDGAKKWQGDAFGARTVIQAAAVSDSNFWSDFIFYDGRFNQTFNGGEVIGIDPPGYVGTAILSLSGANATEVFPQISCEVTRNPNPLNLDADVNVNDSFDTNPMTAAADVISNPWGGSGVSFGVVDVPSFTASAVVLAAEGNFMSLFNQEAASAAEILKEIENQCDCKFYQDPEDDLIKVRLIRRELYDFDNMLHINESNASIVRDFSKASWARSTTRAAASFTNRDKDYDQDILLARSPMVSGSLREDDTSRYSYPLSMDATVASKCLARDMFLLNQPAWRGELQVNRQGANLKPGDCFLLSWEEYNIVDLPVIVQLRRDIAGDVGILIGFSELIDAKGGVLYAIPEPSLFVPVDRSPTSPTDALVVSAPYWVQVWAGYTDRIWNKKIHVCTPIYLMEAYNKTQASFDVRLLNYPNLESLSVGDAPAINRAALYASVGQLLANISQYDGWNDGIMDTLSINGVTRPQYIKPSGIEGVSGGSIFAFVDNEIMSFEFAEELGGGVWQLTNIHRGLLDTAPANHAAGTKLWIINGNWIDRIGMSFDIEPDYIPEFLFCSRTADEKQTDDGLLYTDWTPDNRVNQPLRPVATMINGNRGTGAPLNLARSAVVAVSWKTRSRNKIKRVALYADAAHPPEVTANGTWQTHKVWLTDFAGTAHDLGETSSSPVDANELDVTIPPGSAVGIGFVWVQAMGTFGNAAQAEHYAVNIT